MGGTYGRLTSSGKAGLGGPATPRQGAREARCADRFGVLSQVTVRGRFSCPSRSEDGPPRLNGTVPEPSHRELHPLLLEPEYWRHRLQEQRSIRPFLLITPRPDLSSAGCEVQEIRFQSHDGVRLWGLVGRCPLIRCEQAANLRFVGPCERPTIDHELVQTGRTEFVVQSPAGRRLEDRVLDAVRLCEVAASFDSVDPSRVGFERTPGPGLPDDVRIADQLRLGGLTS